MGIELARDLALRTYGTNFPGVPGISEPQGPLYMTSGGVFCPIIGIVKSVSSCSDLGWPAGSSYS